MEQKNKLKSLASNIDANIRIGKNGVTENIISEIKKQLFKHKLIKIKFLKSSLPIEKEKINEITIKTLSEVIELKGNILVLYKR